MLKAYFDGNCGVCQSTCAMMRALDWRRRIEFIDLHEAGFASEGIRDVSRTRLMSEIHVLDDNGELHAGFAGARRMLREAPLGLPLWLLLLLPGADVIGKRVYRFVAGNRYRLNTLRDQESPECEDGACRMLR